MNFYNFLKKSIKKIKNFIKIVLGIKYYFYKGLKKYDLIVFDTIFPHPISGFRLEEFKILLSHFKNSKILLSSESYSLVKSSKELHKIHINDFLNKNINLKNKLKPFKGFLNINTKLFYCIFLNNMIKFIDTLEEKKIPFIFTLYPGGGFQMDDEISNFKLKKICSSSYFKTVIVTQKITKEYLLKNNFCKEDKIKLIFGGVVPQNSLKNNLEKKYYFKDKNTLDICFCAAKYMPKGIDKGYDVFIKLAHNLSHKYNFINFHIIGGYNEEEIDVTTIKNNITFYGYLNFTELETIFKNIDIIISPNKSFVLYNGAFDGFPLGTVVEAALNGVMVILSDDLNQNTLFIDNQELIITESTSESIEKIILNLIDNPNKLVEIAKNGKEKFQKVYSNNNQMKPRIEILENFINN